MISGSATLDPHTKQKNPMISGRAPPCNWTRKTKTLVYFQRFLEDSLCASGLGIGEQSCKKHLARCAEQICNTHKTLEVSMTNFDKQTHFAAAQLSKCAHQTTRRLHSTQFLSPSRAGKNPAMALHGSRALVNSSDCCMWAACNASDSAQRDDASRGNRENFPKNNRDFAETSATRHRTPCFAGSKSAQARMELVRAKKRRAASRTHWSKDQQPQTGPNQRMDSTSCFRFLFES